MSRRRRFWAALTLSPLVLGSCADGGDAPSTTTVASDHAPDDAAADLSSFASIPDLAEAIVSAGHTCTPEYEGLEDDEKTVSICIVDGEQALLTIWRDPATVSEFVESGAATAKVAYGANWTIDFASPDLAATVAVGIGGSTPP